MTLAATATRDPREDEDAPPSWGNPPQGPRRPPDHAVYWCSPTQHIWLEVPTSWRCACGELEIVNGDGEPTKE